MPELVSAFAPEGTKLAHELISELIGVNELPFELNLISLSSREGGIIQSTDLPNSIEMWLDYLPNSLAWPLMSEKLKNIIDENLTGREGLGWIKANVNGKGERRIYYIPYFTRLLDVLDMTKTLFVKDTDHIIKPHFSLDKVINYSIFHQPSAFNLWKITSGLYVRKAIKDSILKAKLKGIEFELAKVS